MSITAMLRQSLSTLWHNRVRSALTVLGVVIGIAAVIALVGLSAGLRAQVTERLSGLDATRVTVASADPARATAERQGPGPGGGRGGFAFAPSDPTLTVADYEAIGALADVAAASPQLVSQTDVALSEDAEVATQYQLAGVDVDYASLADLAVADGRWLTADQVAGAESVVVLGADAAAELLPDGAVGQSLWIGGAEHAVVGVLDEVEAAAGFGASQAADPNGQVFTAYTTVLAAADDEAMSTIALDATADEAVPALQASIEELLADRHQIATDANPDFRVTSNQDLVDTIQSTNSAFTTTLTGIAAISLLVGGIGIMNIMLMTVTERTREIGLRRAIGAKRRHILTQFLTEAVVLTTLGGLVGLAVGYLLGGQAGQVLTIGGRGAGGGVVAPVFEPSTAVLAVAVAVAVGIVFGIAPAMRAARLDPAAALRYE